ncbi:hypothetical protein [Rhodococcus opacus]|nr:hypothetical protein [Rhodococcus opacus]MDJ0413344.1 hypothetical protein [Rhodococcus opacus]
MIIAPLGTFEAGRAFYDDLARRTVEAGRPAVNPRSLQKVPS